MAPANDPQSCLGGEVGVEDALFLHQAGVQADALTGEKREEQEETL